MRGWTALLRASTGMKVKKVCGIFIIVNRDETTTGNTKIKYDKYEPESSIYYL